MTTSQLKKGLSIAGFILALLLLIAYGSNAEEPNWIQFNERLSGANSPDYTDVLNRPLQEFWGNTWLLEHNEDGTHKTSGGLSLATFSIDHNLDGTHKTPIPTNSDALPEGTVNLYYKDWRVSNHTDVTANTTHRADTENPHNVTAEQIGALSNDDRHSEWALHGDGTGTLAEQIVDSGMPLTYQSPFSVRTLVMFTRPFQEESLYTHIETEYETVMFRFFRDSSAKMSLTVGDQTVTGPTMTSSGLPVEVGAYYNPTTGVVGFRINGEETTANFPSPPIIPVPGASEKIILGDGLAGDMFWIGTSWGDKLMMPGIPLVALMPEHIFAFAIDGESFYNMNEGGGNILYNRLYPDWSYWDLAVTGDWVKYPQGY